MGCYSFLTSDTNKSIESDFHGFILTPDKAIEVIGYNLSGRFETTDGSIDLARLLVSLNYPSEEIQDLDDESLRMLGAKLQPPFGRSHLETKSGQKLACSLHVTLALGLFLGFKKGDLLFPHFEYELEIEGVTTSINKHVESGRLSEILMSPKVPLKITEKIYDYYDVDGVKSCPFQGIPPKI
jgi:hypothetical protein